jgi:predicted HD phosphohydrolase
MTAAAVLFPPEIFVDQLLVTIRDATVRVPGSTVPYHEHARQAAALATRSELDTPTVAAALLYGVGEIVVRTWARHPAVEPDVLDPMAAGLAHLDTHFPAAVTEPIALLGRARAYTARRADGRGPGPEDRRFETEAYAREALELVEIDRLTGRGPMITPPLDAYRDLLHGLCRPALVVEPAFEPIRPGGI